MNIHKVKESALPIRNSKSVANSVEKQYNRVLGKKTVYSDNEIFVFNAMRSAQKILERYEN